MRADTRGGTFLGLLVVLSMLGPLTLNILVPSLPGMVQSLNSTKETVQLTLSLYLLGMAVSQLVLGPLADRFGRRPVVMVALVIYTIASIAAFAAPNVELLIIARLCQSFGATAGLTLGRAMIRDLYDENKSASMIGYVTMAMVVAPMIAPTLGAFIDSHFGWRAILLFCALLGVPSFIIAALALPETRPVTLIAASAKEVMTRSLGLVKNPRFMAYWGASAFCSGIFFAFLGSAPYLMIDVLGQDKRAYGFWFMSLSLGYMLGNFISGRMVYKLGTDILIYWGNIAGLLGAVMILAVAGFGTLSPLALFLPAMITSFGNGLVLPNAIASAIGVDPKAGGAGSGLMGFGQMGVGALMSYLAGHTTTTSAMPLAEIMLVCAVLSLASGWLSRKPRSAHHATDQA